ncbi:phosphotransferase [Formosa haliotis]|uniref:phosphotransferase n=1 Tax=Formosa haliotis TaxID=1555194 RepID=UPI000825D162|nr:phosphotransferase [Formosa haliotis]
MTVFPVITSTISASAIGAFLIETYGFSQSASCTLFRTGMNHTYMVSDFNCKYVFRIYCYKWRTKLEIIEELRLLTGLEKKAVSVSYPLKDKEGEFIQDIQAPEGLRYGVLFSFAEGDKMRFLDEKTCFSIGQLMAKFHKSTQNKSLQRKVYNAETLLKAPYRKAKSYFNEALDEMQFIKTQIDEISKTFNAINEETLRKGVVHLDIWYDNMSVKNTNDITLFDFDFCGNGWFIFDIGYFCKQLFHIEMDKSNYELKRNKFLEGYNSVLTLRQVELDLLPKAGLAVYIFYLGIQCERFDWSNIFLSENYLKMYVGRMHSWNAYNQENILDSCG